MKELRLSIAAGDSPPSASSIEGVRSALESLRERVSGICTPAACLALLGFIALEIKWIGAATGETLPKVFFAVGLGAFFIAREYLNIVSRRIAEFSPIDETLLPEAARLANASPIARAYVDQLREQGRDLILAELRALRTAAADTPIDVARKSLYG